MGNIPSHVPNPHYVERTYCGGKDRPAQMGAKKLSDLGKTVGIMLQMCEPIFGTGKDVVLESGFYVEKVITTLE